MKHLDNYLTLLVGILTVALIGYIDQNTSWYVSFTIFYLIPLLLTWYTGFFGGLIIALCCGISMAINELLWNISYPNHIMLYWNTGSKLLVFIFVVYLISALKKQIVSLEARISEETEKRINNERILARHTRMAEMGEMIGAIAHQWRQPLSAILTSAQTVKMAWKKHDINEAFLKQIEEDIKEQITYMSDTITTFRNFFSPDKRVETINVGENIHEVIALLSSQLARSPIDIHLTSVSSQDNLFLVKGYVNEFKQALVNVITNAIDAIVEKTELSPDAPDTGDRRGTISIALSKSDTAIEITITDNGCGIPPEYADRVFEPYFTSKSNGRGTGIGLYMVKLIVVESMGGMIRFDSSDKGTTFRIMLPLEC